MSKLDDRSSDYGKKGAFFREGVFLLERIAGLGIGSFDENQGATIDQILAQPNTGRIILGSIASSHRLISCRTIWDPF